MTNASLWGRSSDLSGPRERWEQRTSMPLAGVALLFLLAYAVPILRPEAPRGVLIACDVLDVVTYLLFVGDYLTRLALSRNRIGFLRHSTMDLLVLLLPMFRPLRSLRLVTLLQLLDRRIGRTLRGQIVVYLMVATGFVLFVASLAVLDAERDAPSSNIKTFGDALWWASTTITTVGYGEHHPVTPTGRVVAASLMFSGIALLGVVTASIASWMVERLRESEEEAEALTRADIEALTDEVRALTAQVKRLTAERDTPKQGDGSTGGDGR